MYIEKFIILVKDLIGDNEEIFSVDFIKEVIVIRTLEHPNIVKFFGACEHGINIRRYLVTEWIELGSIDKYLRKAMDVTPLDLVLM